jgi:hypothetical protein
MRSGRDNSQVFALQEGTVASGGVGSERDKILPIGPHQEHQPSLLILLFLGAPARPFSPVRFAHAKREPSPCGGLYRSACTQTSGGTRRVLRLYQSGLYPLSQNSATCSSRKASRLRPDTSHHLTLGLRSSWPLDFGQGDESARADLNLNFIRFLPMTGRRTGISSPRVTSRRSGDIPKNSLGSTDGKCRCRPSICKVLLPRTADRMSNIPELKRGLVKFSLTCGRGGGKFDLLHQQDRDKGRRPVDASM